MKELNEGEEICPICKMINNPGFNEIHCPHYLALLWEGEIHWPQPIIEKLLMEIREIQEILFSHEQLGFTKSDTIFKALDPEFNSPTNSLFDLINEIQIIYENREDNGSSIYIDDISLLKSKLLNLIEFKLNLTNKISNS